MSETPTGAGMKGKSVALAGAENRLSQAIETAFAGAGARTRRFDPELATPAQAVVYVAPAPVSESEVEVVRLLEDAWLSVQAAMRCLRTDGGALVIVLPCTTEDAGSLALASLRGGLEMLARSLAAECGAGPAPVRVNALAADRGFAEDVAGLVVFLASEAASFVTGQVVAPECA